MASKPECQADEFKCNHIHQCVAQNRTCDGKLDCIDQSDESNETCPEVIPCGSADKFQCRNGVCVNQKQLCNGLNECGDASDEDLCGES